MRSLYALFFCALFMGSFDVLFYCAVCIRSLYALFLYPLFMRPFYVLFYAFFLCAFLCALFMRSFYVLFYCALCIYSFYVLFLCALFMRSFYSAFLCAVFMCYLMCSFHKRLRILHMREKYYCTKTNIADNKIDGVLKKLGLSDHRARFVEEKISTDIVCYLSIEDFVKLGLTDRNAICPL